MKTIGIGTSHAKIILIGEHSVVYGQPAIALPLPNVNLKVSIQITGNNSRRLIHSRYFDGLIEQLPPKMAGIKQLITTLIDRFHGQRDSWAMTIDSQLPAERGMGSSAASAIAIVRAFFDLYQQSLDRELLLKLADIEEQITHRSPSGLDAATCSSNQPIWFIKGQAGTTFDMHLAATMVIADTGKTGATKAAIMAVRQLLKKRPDQAKGHIEHLGQLTKQAQANLRLNQPSQLGHVLTESQSDLRALNVSDQSLDHLIQVALDNDALGAKLTGGGRGGCMFAITANKAKARQLAKTLEDNGARRTWLQPMNG